MKTKEILQFALGPLGSAFLGFVTIPVTAWFFSSENIGRLALLQVVIGFASVLFSMGLDQSYIREYNDSKNKIKLWKQCIFPGLFFLIIVFLTFLINPSIISVYIFNVNSIILGLLIILILTSNYFSRFFFVILRMKEKSISYSVNQIIPKFFNIFFLIFFVFVCQYNDFVWLLSSYAIAAVLSCIISAFNTRSEWYNSLKESISFKELLPLIKFGIPLTVGSLAIWGLNSLDKFLLNKYSGFSELGIYSVAYTFAGFAMVLQNVFSTVWSPIIYKSINEGNHYEILSKVSDYMGFGVLFVFSMSGIFSWLVDYIVPQTFNQVKFLITACMAAPLFYIWSETTSIGISIVKRTNFSMFVSLISLMLNIILNYILIPKFGAQGAAISCCLSFYLFFILKTEFSRLVWKPIPRFRNYFFASLVTFLSVSMVIYGSEYHYYFILLWFFILVYTLFSLLKKININFKFD